MTEEKKISREDMRLSWTDGHENILKQWGEASACYRYMHHRAFFIYRRSSIRFTLPVIILSTITGTANFAQGTFPENVQSFAPSIIGGLNLTAGLIATISQFLKINELMENHRTAALAFGMLSRNIRLMLALDRGERSKEGLDFVGECKTEYDRLLEQSPSVPKSVLKLHLRTNDRELSPQPLIWYFVLDIAQAKQRLQHLNGLLAHQAKSNQVR